MSPTTAACLARKAYFATTAPPGRRELVTSPYPQYSMEELAIRRKIECLKHTHSHPQTKTSKYLSLVRRPKRDPTNCPVDETTLTYSYQCNIPGPIFSFRYNKNVPLYLYSQGNNNQTNSNLVKTIN